MWKQEYRNAMELLQQDYARKIEDLENQIRRIGFQVQKTVDDGTIKHLHEDVIVHKTHSESLSNRLKRVHFDVETQYHHEIQDLKDCLMIEQEEKNELNKRLQNLEKELLISRTKLTKHHRDTTSNRHVETLKQKIMKLRKENEVLKRQFLPPKIGRTMPNLASKETQLEDASGQRWTVTLSWREESLAFHQGWASFSREHGLEVGDLLVFHCILGSHFVVQIYGKNGCERLHFSAENGSRKKRRTNTPSAAKDGKYHSTDRNSMNKKDQVASALSGSNMEIATDNALIIVNGSPRKMLNEVQLCMIGMDARHRHEEDHRNSLYDLSTFEMQRTSDVDGTAVVLEHERSPCDGNILLTSQAGADIVDRIPVTEKVVAPDVPNLEVPEANEDFQVTEKVVLVSTKDSGNGNTIGEPQSEKTKSSSYQILIPQTEDTTIMPSCQSARQKSAGKKINEAKTKQLEMKTEVFGFRDVVNGKYPEPKDSGNSSNHPAKKEDYVFKAVKTEPVDTSDSPSADYGTTSLMVAETKAFLDDKTFPNDWCNGWLWLAVSCINTACLQAFMANASKSELSMMLCELGKSEMIPVEAVDDIGALAQILGCRELPRRLPKVKPKPSQGDSSSRRAVVLLRDPESRLWPVVYLEKSQIKALTSGWEVFVKENNIRPGDECAFEVENEREGTSKNEREVIFKVGIVRK
ncbi:hypothetical protein RHMOL_Rhmol01G0116700 [Rhododendron molle]|uniref:Uncharacterized protein n=1 Tax=Rhododendron molle TaxID=49168 RepID=A0ACC0Q1V1_RHOML|nr:hypothetical protein RHMOL_Rhmol01G0116700 [Rhododendron molle]